MEKYDYLKNLNIEDEIIDLLKEHFFLEKYKIGEEIINPSIAINKFSIILFGNVRKIKKNTSVNSNIYKYARNDFLFIPELIYSIENPYFYIASNDLTLISVGD